MQGLKIFLIVTIEGGATNNSWIEARDAAKDPTMPRAAPTVKNSQASNLSSARLSNTDSTLKELLFQEPSQIVSVLSRK